MSNVAYNAGWLIMMLPDSPSCGSEGNAAVQRDAFMRRQLEVFLLPFVSIIFRIFACMRIVLTNDWSQSLTP